MFSVIYRLFDDWSCFQIKSTWLQSGPCPPPPTPASFTTSLILSLIFPTWVMALVIPNDSRNKSAVMRSHWVGFFLSLKSPFTATYNQPVPRTQTGFWIGAPVNQRETHQFLPPPCSQNGHPVLLSISVFFQYPRLIIFWLSGAHILASC